jgi:GTP-binding protein EngB required for normal cell division
MNENHQRHLLVTFRHIDNLLSEAEHVLASAGSASPFAEYTQDSTPVQRKVIHDYIQQVREALSRALAELNLPRPAPVCGALWAARGHVSFAGIAVAEIEPKRMAGYGALTETDCQALNRVVAELDAAIDRLAAYLDKGPAADLQTRLRRLDQTRDAVPLLRELERVITGHGLIECRGALAILLDRLENQTFEIGVFGRVSSGKSSLLNHLLGTDVLPVGVTPITAIPTRVQFGHKPRAAIEFADRRPMEVELTRLAEFSSEPQNPGNTKHVARILVEFPAARLREGVTFVDTPGLGSLATSGAEETIAYLPRCDLGLVLVDAGSTLTHEELTVVQGLSQAGARAMVLVSKADLLQPPDRERTLAYAKQQMAGQLGADVPVHLVSVVGADATLCQAWFERELKPLLETHRDQAAASLRRKIGGLREAVVRALEARLQGPSPRAPAPSSQAVADAVNALREADYWIESAQKECAEMVEATPGSRDVIFEATAAELVATWRAGRATPEAAAAALGGMLRKVLADHTAKLMRRLEDLRQQLETALAKAHRAVQPNDDAAEPLPKPFALPLFDPTSLLERASVQPPFWGRALGAHLLRRHAQTRLRAHLDSALADSLDNHRRRLRQWLARTLAELRTTFHARAGLLRPQLETGAHAPAAETDAARLAADLERLRAWPA